MESPKGDFQMRIKFGKHPPGRVGPPTPLKEPAPPEVFYISWDPFLCVSLEYAYVREDGRGWYRCDDVTGYFYSVVFELVAVVSIVFLTVPLL